MQETEDFAGKGMNAFNAGGAKITVIAKKDQLNPQKSGQKNEKHTQTL